jgi:hypothetical protein
MAIRNSTESGLLKAVRAAQTPLPLARDTEFRKYVRKTRMTIADVYRFGASEAQETIVNWIVDLHRKESAKRRVHHERKRRSEASMRIHTRYANNSRCVRRYAGP